MKDEASARQVANTAGELEREAKSRKYNIIEAFFVMNFVLVVLWWISYPFGELAGNSTVNTITTILLTLGAIYLLFISPFIHHDRLTSWGLGNPLALFRLIRTSAPPKAGILIAMVIALIAGLMYACYAQWAEVADFLFDMDEADALAMQASTGGKAAIIALGFVLATFLATFVIRYDNFLSALFMAFKIILVLGALLYGGALLFIGPKAFADFQPTKYALDIFGYVFWGALQQLLFSSYFGTRMRKGFAPAADPKRRFWTRFWVAVVNGSFFGLIHINSWYLVGFTWLLGIFLSWAFMEDKNRNLIALGFIHGFLGSSTGWLFSSEKGGLFEVEMGVGPAHVDGFSLSTMIITSLLIAGFTAFMVYAWRNWKEEPST